VLSTDSATSKKVVQELSLADQHGRQIIAYHTRDLRHSSRHGAAIVHAATDRLYSTFVRRSGRPARIGLD
jgi:hypothetical protein